MPAKRRKIEPKTEGPKGKTPEQLAQWDAYEELCRQREVEAAVRRASAKELEDNRNAFIKELRKAEAVSHQAARYEHATQLRRLADAVAERISEETAEEVRRNAQAWRNRTLEAADALDPINEIVATFSTSRS